MASSPGEDMGSLDDGQAYKSEADLDQQPSSRVSAVLTCSGNLTDPDFNEKCSALFDRLQNVLRNDEINVVKCEPWNSVKITFDLPTEAAQRLSELAELARRGDDNTLRQLGILSLQLQGGQIISVTLADGSNNASSSAAASSRTSPSTSTSRVDSSAIKAEGRDVTSAVASRLPASTAISVVSSRTGASSPHLLSPSSSSPSSSSPSIHSASSTSLLDRAGSQIKRNSAGLLANSINQRTKTNRSAGGSSTNSSLLVNLLQKDAGSIEIDSSPPEKKRRKYSSQGGVRDMDSSPSVTKVANAMMAGHHSVNGPTGLSESERILAERLASAASAGTTLIPPKSEGLCSGNDRAKGSHNQYGKKQTDIDAVSSSPKGSNNKSVSRTGNSHLNTQIHSESSIQRSVSESKKDVKSAISGRSASLSNSMMPPPKSKNSASSISSSLSNSISSETNSSASNSNSSDKQQRVQHPAIVGGGVGRDNQVQPQPLRSTTDLLDSKQIQNRAAAGPKSRQILINPNTGMLESGPSESSSEGENDLDGSGATAAATSDKRKSGGVLNAIASGLVRNQTASSLTSNVERALKVKLRLPSTPQQVQQQQKGDSSSSSPSLLNNAVNHISSSNLPETNSIADSNQSGKTNTNTSNERIFTETKTKVVEPKLPKLILSMRGQKVKVSQESVASASNKSQKESSQTLSSVSVRGDRKKERKPTTSEDEGTDSEEVEEDDEGDDYHPTDEEEEEDEEDIDYDPDDDEEALKIATAKAKNLRMMQLHASSSPSRNVVSSRTGLGESLSNKDLDADSSRDKSKVQNRTTNLSQEKHLKSLETSRSKFLRMRQQQRNKKQNMQLNQTPKVDLWKDSLNIREVLKTGGLSKIRDKEENRSMLSNNDTESGHSQTIESRLALTSKEDKDDLPGEKGMYNALSKHTSSMGLDKTSEAGKVMDDLKLHTTASDQLGGQRKTSEGYIHERSSAFSSSTLPTKSQIEDHKSHSKEDSSSTEDPIRQLLYSSSTTSALSSSGSSTSSNSSGADKQDLSLDPQCEQSTTISSERNEMSVTDPISSLSLPQRDIDSRDTHQQGEDSGIESMDTLSEKSPNQGEDPFPNQEKLDRELKDMNPVMLSSPKHNQSSSTSPPRTSQRPTAKSLTIEGSNANESNLLTQHESSSIIASAKVIQETVSVTKDTTITPPVKRESVQLPPKREEETHEIEKNTSAKISLDDSSFSDYSIKVEEIKQIHDASKSSSCFENNVREDKAESNLNKVEEKINIDTMSKDGSSLLSVVKNASGDGEYKPNLASNINSNDNESSDTKSVHNIKTEITDTSLSNTSSGSAKKGELVHVKNENNKSKIDVIDSPTESSNRTSNTTPSISIPEQQEPKLQQSSSIGDDSKQKTLLETIPISKSSNIMEKNFVNHDEPNKNKTSEEVEVSKQPPLVVEKTTSNSTGGNNGNAKLTEAKDNVARGTDKTSNYKMEIDGSSNQTSVSVSLIRLPVASGHTNDTNTEKKVKEYKFETEISAKATALSTPSPSASGIHVASVNGINVSANGTLIHSNQDDHERSSSSTPEIPFLTASTELVTPSSTVANCITLHSAASAMGRTSSPILTNGTAGGGIQVHRAGGLNNIPPGAKMVPVKLVSVPGGDGNMPGMRLVRVSPVKSHPSIHQGHQGGITMDPNTLGSVPGTRTVVIKSSMLKSATTAAMSQAAAHQHATIISTAASNHSFTSTSISTAHGGSSTFSITPNASPLPPHIVTSQPLSPSLLVNTSQNSISATPPSCVLKEANAPPQIHPINNAGEHISNAAFSISNHNHSSTTVERVPQTSMSSLNSSVHTSNLPISVSLARRSISASVVPVPAMNTISSVAASSSGVTTLLGPSLSITPVEVGTTGPHFLPSSKSKLIVEHNKPTTAILNSVLASMAPTALRNSEPSPMIVTGVSRNHISGTTVVENPVLLKSATDIACLVQNSSPVTVSLKPKITEALKIQTESPKAKGLNSRSRAAKSPQRHHSNGDDFGGGGSLLRPLLQKEETLPATVITTHLDMGTIAATSINASAAALQKGKRRRRHDTGSSTKSDKSDNSLTDSLTTSSAKKCKMATADNKKSQQQNSSSSVSPAASPLVNAQKTTAKGVRGRGKKEDMQAKEAEKNVTVTASDPVKLGVQTPAKKNSRGGSNSSTESLTKGTQGGKNSKSNASCASTSKGSSPVSSASPSPSRTRKSALDDPSSEQANKGISTQEAGTTAKERRSARKQTAALAAAADKTTAVPTSIPPTSNGSELCTSTTASATVKVASNRSRRGGEDNVTPSTQTNASSSTTISPAQTRTRKATEDTTNTATNGKTGPGRPTRKSTATEISTSSSPGSITSSSESSLSGNGANNNSVNTGTNGSGLSVSKEENPAAGKPNTPSEEQRTMKTRSAK